MTTMDLFGGALGADPSARVPAARPTRRGLNDMALVRDVIRAAISTGYVVAVRGQRVYRVTGKDSASTCPRYETDTVHQLLDAGLLRIGTSRRLVAVGAVSIDACPVLVPRTTRNTLARWDALAALPAPRGR